MWVQGTSDDHRRLACSGTGYESLEEWRLNIVSIDHREITTDIKKYLDAWEQLGR
jgi:hypothetical protein